MFAQGRPWRQRLGVAAQRALQAAAAVPTAATAAAAASVVFEVSRGVHDLSWLADHPHQAAADGVAGRKREARRAPPARTWSSRCPTARSSPTTRASSPTWWARARAPWWRAGGRGGRGNAALAGARNRVPRTRRAGRGRRGASAARGAPHGGRRGPRRAPERREVDAAVAAHRRHARRSRTTRSPRSPRTWAWPAGTTDRFVVADIPGLIEGASEGTRPGAPVPPARRAVPGARAGGGSVGRDPAADLATLRAELAAYDAALATRPAIVVGTKADLVDDPRARAVAGRARRLGRDRRRARGAGVERSASSRERAGRRRARAPPARRAAAGTPTVHRVSREGGGWRVHRARRGAVGAGDRPRGRATRSAPPGATAPARASSGSSPLAGARRGDEVRSRDRVFEFLARTRRATADGRGRALVAEEDAAWGELMPRRRARPRRASSVRPRITPDGWSAEDAMFHIAAWRAECGAAARTDATWARATRPDESTSNGRTANGSSCRGRWTSGRRARGARHVARTGCVAAFGALPEVTPDAWEWFEESGPLHYAAHVEDLRSWRTSVRLRGLCVRPAVGWPRGNAPRRHGRHVRPDPLRAPRHRRGGPACSSAWTRSCSCRPAVRG